MQMYIQKNLNFIFRETLVCSSCKYGSEVNNEISFFQILGRFYLLA